MRILNRAICFSRGIKAGLFDDKNDQWLMRGFL
jgi:hypothetical protein